MLKLYNILQKDKLHTLKFLFHLVRFLCHLLEALLTTTTTLLNVFRLFRVQINFLGTSKGYTILPVSWLAIGQYCLDVQAASQ